MGKAEVMITYSALTDFRPTTRPSADDLAAFVPQRRMPRKIRVARIDETPRWLSYVIHRLTELHVLRGDPDDEVPMPTSDALDRALPEVVRFLSVDTPTPSVVPTAEGGIAFVWHKAGWDIEVEVGSTETFVWARDRNGDAMWAGPLDERISLLRALLFELSNQA